LGEVLLAPLPVHLAAHKYRARGVFMAGQAATSALLPGFQVDVNELFVKCDEADGS
jgi:hypothetical protein